jgi:hypothetical protein
MKQFHSEKFNASNVLTMDVDNTVVLEFAALLNQPLAAEHFHVTRPNWHSDIEWLSPNSLLCFRYFLERFIRLGVAAHVEPYLDLDNACRMYSGFFVRRSSCQRADFHLDWVNTNNEAFTLITPVTANTKGFGLLYRQDDGVVAEYEYRIGEAIIFGDRFSHATKPGCSSDPVVLLSYTFGTDKMVHWHTIEPTGGNQGNLVRLPNGDLRVRDLPG